MHHIPRILAGKSRESSQGGSSEMEPKKSRGRKKLDRRNAMKNIEYEASTYYSDYGTPIGSSSEYFDDKTSFRIEGVEGEFDRIFRSLDLTGIDDFSIPTEEWEEAMKARSLPEHQARSRFYEFDGIDVERSSTNHSTSVSKTSDRGIKGTRPSPVMKPPIYMALPKPTSRSPSWDAPRNTGLLSESSSFTTSHDDDSSSTTTDIYNISPNSQFKRVITEWEKGKLLGSGSFGSVYEGIAEDGFFFAVKEVSLLDQGTQAKQSVSQLQQEIDLLSQFEHENIVQYYGTATEPDGSKIYIFLELVSQGSLLSLYNRYHLKDSQVSAYTRQILHGLKYLHDQNVVHRDIKCANILVDANGSVKLADFGLAKATKLNDVRSSKGTPFWMAPEVVKRRTNGYGLQADIWSLGCTVLEMLTRQFPYSEAEGPMQALFRIGGGIPPSVPETLSLDAQDFILRCLKVDPLARPSATELLDHTFVKRPLSLSSGSSSPYVRRRSR